MHKRAEQIDDTRRRIVQAAAGLHGTVGPAHTTIAGIARAAGVTRLTVYRHFPDDEAMFEACSAHWLAGQIPPNPGAWAQLDDPVERLRAGLADLYRFYRDGEPMLTRVNRDRAALPAGRRRALDDRDAHIRRTLVDPFPGAGRRLRAVLAHAASFWTWRSLCVEHELAAAEAVEVMVALATATAAAERGGPPAS